MSLKGIDIASYQAGLDAGSIAADFVIIKATEGTGYVNPYCDSHFQQARAAGKRLGVYHFARNGSNDAIAEADFFVNNVKGYIKNSVLILDWEDGGNVGDVAWAERWIRRVIELTGVIPMIYMSESVVNSHDWTPVVKLNVGLWVAKYRDYATDVNYDMSQAGAAPSVKWWNGYAMWQWTSSGRLNGWGGNLDLNEFYGDTAAWDRYAQSVAAPQGTPPATMPSPQPAGRTYTVARGDTLSSIAAKFGTSWQHLQAINGIANANLIYTGQTIKIDDGAAAPAPTARYYTVNRGEYLSLIAKNTGSTVDAIVRANGIANPNLIFPGQVLRIP